VRIRHTSMTTLTQIWMMLLLSNILPSDHNSDLPLLKCQLVYAILTQVSVHVAQLIFDAIYHFAGVAPTRHPMDPEKSNRALGFPAITASASPTECPSPPARSSSHLLKGPSSRNTASPGRHRTRHRSNQRRTNNHL